MPKPPEYVNRFQFITFFIFNKCHHPATLYIEYAFPPAVEAARSILMFDLPQIVRSLFRPKGIRTKRHGRKTAGKRGATSSGIPDYQEQFATDVRETFDVGDRVVTDGHRQLWTFLDIGEKWLGRFFLLEIVEEWLYKWALMIDVNDAQPCSAGSVRAEGGGTFAGGGGGIASVGGADAVWATGLANCFNGTLFMPYPRWMVVFSGTAENIGTGLGTGTTITVIIGIPGPDGHFIEGVEKVLTLSYLETDSFLLQAFFQDGEASGCFFGVTVIADDNSRVHVAVDVIFAQAF